MPPTGFKRSRALWDNARRPHDTQKQHWMSWIRAILYELQPIRSSEMDVQGWARKSQSLWQGLITFITSTLPFWTEEYLSMLSNLTIRGWMIIAGVFGYYAFVRYVHYALDAGPVVVILTILVGIFTIGLSDDENKDGLSAYSVFNRGFQRLLGSLDANEILAQHVGGGFMPAAVMPPEEPVRPQRPRARPVQPEARPPEPARENADAEDEQPPDNNRNGGSRKSGKKARRQNREQRQEIRRQREAAIAMGFGGGEEEAAAAMNRLVEDQVANPDE